MDRPENRIKELREQRGEARTEVATLCRVTERSVYRWEDGTTALPDAHKRTLSQHFDVTAEHLMGWDRVAQTSKKSPRTVVAAGGMDK